MAWLLVRRKGTTSEDLAARNARYGSVAWCLCNASKRMLCQQGIGEVLVARTQGQRVIGWVRLDGWMDGLMNLQEFENGGLCPGESTGFLQRGSRALLLRE